MALGKNPPPPDPDETALADAETENKPAKKSSPLLIYLSIAVAMVVIGYFAGTHFLGSAEKTVAGEEAAEAPEEVINHDAEIVTIDDIIVNPSGTGGTRFLSTSIGFEVSSKEAAEMFEKRIAIIKDALITILGAKSLEQLSDPKEKEITRYQIKKRVEQLLNTDNLEGVYFTTFVLQ